MSGLFGRVFDFNRDGKMNAFERAAEFAFFEDMMSDNQKTEFEMSGLDAEKLEYMDAYERREVLEAAGLDLDEYDF